VARFPLCESDALRSKGSVPGDSFNVPGLKNAGVRWTFVTSSPSLRPDRTKKEWCNRSASLFTARRDMLLAHCATRAFFSLPTHHRCSAPLWRPQPDCSCRYRGIYRSALTPPTGAIFLEYALACWPLDGYRLVRVLGGARAYRPSSILLVSTPVSAGG